MIQTRRQRGFSLVELLITLATISVLTAIAIPLMQEAMLRAHISAAATDANAIYKAFKRFHIDYSRYPYASTAPALDLATLEPLISGDYYDGRALSRLKNNQADGYDSPDNDQEFWLEITLKYDPTIRFLISDSDDAPLSGGAFYDGIFLFKNGVETPLPGGTNQ